MDGWIITVDSLPVRGLDPGYAELTNAFFEHTRPDVSAFQASVLRLAGLLEAC